MRKQLIKFMLALALTLPHAYAADEPTIQSMQVYFRSIELKADTAKTLAKFDLVMLDRFGFDRVSPNTWTTIKTAGNVAKNRPTLLLYQLGPWIRDDTDKMTTYWLNNLGRYKADRGVSGDALATSHPDWFIKNKTGANLTEFDTNTHLLDFGNQAVRDYWKRITQKDIIDQKWKADGIFIDVVSPYYFGTTDAVAGKMPAKYNDAATWDRHMNDFVSDVAKFLRDKKQLSMFNRTYSHTATGNAAWMALDAKADAPDIIWEEGAFTVSWGSIGDAQFYNLEEWERQVNLPAKLKKSAVAYEAHTNLAVGGTGLSSSLTPITFQQVFQFALGSYLVSIPQTGIKPYFGFDFDRKNSAPYSQIVRPKVFDDLKLGAPLSGIEKQQSGAATIYSKKFEKGTVYVNPTKFPSANLQFANMQRVNMDWNNGLVYGKVNEGGVLPAFSAIIYVPASVPNAPVLNIQQN